MFKVDVTTEQKQQSRQFHCIDFPSCCFKLKLLSERGFLRLNETWTFMAWPSLL